MAPPRYLPSDSKLKQLARTMTHQQIADWVYRETGHKVARSTVSAALSRMGETDRVRYDDVIPWRVRLPHTNHYALMMLRYYARRKHGLELTQDQSERLDSWLSKLKDMGGVVAYYPDSEDGFYYVPRLPEDKRGIIRQP
jgi:hypothetical protein